MPIDGYLAHDYPIGIDGTFIKRVQTAEFNRELPTERRYELGTKPPVGVIQRPTNYRGRLVWFPIDLALETALSRGGSAIVTWKEFMDSTGVTIVGPKAGHTGAFVTALEYSARVGADFTATATIEATGWNSGSSITPAPPTGVSNYEAKDITVKIDGVIAARAQGVTVRAGCRAIRLEELGSSNPVKILRQEPTLSVDIDWVESDSATGTNSSLTINDPGDIEIIINNALKLQCLNMVFASEGRRGNVGGFSTIRMTYESLGQDNTNANLKIIRLGA